MVVNKETVIRSMVLKNYPDHDVVFKDPLFAFIFLSRSFDEQFSLVFCTNSRFRGKEVSIEKVELDFMTSVKHLTTPTQSLLEQLQTIKEMLDAEKTTALQFSEICRELIVARSQFKFSQVQEKDDTALESFDIRCLDLFKEKDFRRLVSALAGFITSTSDGITWVKNDDCLRKRSPQIFFKTIDDQVVLLWIRDDDYIIVIKMPKSGSNDPADDFLTNNADSTDAFGKKGVAFHTWNEMFGTIPGARCLNAGVVFLICDDRIHYVCARNVNMFDSDWRNGRKLIWPVIWCEPDADLQQTWSETKICPRLRRLNRPFIADGSNLRNMVENTVEHLADEWKPDHPKLMLYLCLSVFLMKNDYNGFNYVSFHLYCERCMFKHSGMISVLREWTAYILGQKGSFEYKEKFEGSENSIFCFRVHSVKIGGISRPRYISWQFIPGRPWMEIFDSLRSRTDLELSDMPGNDWDLRSRVGAENLPPFLHPHIDTACF